MLQTKQAEDDDAAVFTVEQRTSPGGSEGTSGGGLASTGTSIAALTGIGLLCASVGFAVVGITRRRRTHRLR